MDDSPSTNKGVIFVVVTTLAFNATLGLVALAYCLVFKIAPDQVLLTAFISIITGLLGVIGGMLTKTSPTEATKIAAPILPLGSPGAIPVSVQSSETNPVHTEENQIP